MSREKVESRNPWTWVPSLYYAEGIPYALVMLVSVIMYKRMGVSNAKIGFYTGILYLPWVIKPLWSPIIDMLKKKRFWIILMQFIVALGLLGVSLSLYLPNFLLFTMIFFFLMAFSSATHDIAADGFYMLGLDVHQQAYFTGIRSTFYRLAIITAQGFLVIIAGELEKSGDIPEAWSTVFIILTIVFFLFFVYHNFILPHPSADKAVVNTETTDPIKNFFRTFLIFFKKEKIGLIIAFLLIFRMGEAQLITIAQLFLKDPRNVGGLGLTTIQIGFVYGTVGVIALSIGGIIGGLLAARNGLKFWLWPMFVAINIPALVYIFLSYTQPSSFYIISAMVAVEQFCYGFGFTAYMLYMIYIVVGEYKTSHYAIATGFMALSMMVPRLFSGELQELLGYQHFFIWVLLTMIPGIFIVKYLSIDPEFGKKKMEQK